MRVLPLNRRQRTLVTMFFSCLFLIMIATGGILIDPENFTINLDNKNSPPTFEHLFGTDWLGRDMFIRTLEGLTLSMAIGILASISSAVIALFLSLIASWNKTCDRIVTWLIDLFLSVPHLIILLMISFALGGGLKGVIIGLALTHWPSLTRLLRAEVLQIKSQEYVGISRQFGKSWFWIATHHLLPHLMPQLFIGFLLLFPHAILHEAAISFLGFGISSEQPAIGIILSESMRYLSTGMWWLAFFPGISLLFMVALFDLLGKSVNRFMDPFHGQRG